jgi:hypothetical protein
MLGTTTFEAIVVLMIKFDKSEKKNRMFWFPIPDSPISAVSEHKYGMS